MASNILSIGQSALAAAQVGLSTTGHNIANAATPGYSRQVMVQSAALPQEFGFGFLGRGTEIAAVKRIYSEFLGGQLRSAQTGKSGLDSYYAQIKQIDNLLADPASGLSPSLQDFFSGIQEVAANPAAMPSRQAALSAADALAARFNSLASRLDEIEQGVNSQMVASVEAINTYAEQIARLNDAIGKAQGATGKPPNDLLDQRDRLILDLNAEIRATVVKQDDGSFNVFIGNGQPLVVGLTASTLTNTPAPSDPQRLEVAYRNRAGGVAIIGEAALIGGRLGGLLAFRGQTLEPAQNALGRVAIGLAHSFNAQHEAGYDLAGNVGKAFFNAGAPLVHTHAYNSGTAALDAVVSDANALTTSDYRLDYDGSSYTLTRLADNAKTTFSSFPQTIDGLDLNLTGAANAGDSFLIRPTVNGASGFGVAISDPAEIAAAAASGAVGDNRNALQLAALQTAQTLGNGSMSYQGAYSQFVSEVGNKTRELEVTSGAAGKLLSEARTALQAESGVNLDEEAAHLMRYQQAYQAAGKVMQIANEMFSTLLALGGR